MKKSLLAVVAALAIAGCSQNDLVDEIDNGGQTGKTPISFNTSVGKSSRAAIDFNDESLGKSGFTIYSYITDNEFTGISALGTAYMNGVQCTGTVGNWSTGADNYYWPIGKKVQFFAYPTGTVTDYSAATGYPTFTTESGSDLVVAHAANQTGESNGTVTLTFGHIMTKVKVKCTPAVEDNNLDYTVSEIKLKGIKNTGKGTYTFGANTWNLDNVESSEISYTQLEQLMLFPQDASNIRVEVTYTITSKSPAMTIFSGAKTATLSGTWTPSQNILYTLALPNGGSTVKVSASVGQWDEQTPGTSTFN